MWYYSLLSRDVESMSPYRRPNFFHLATKKKKKDQICVFFEVIDIYFISLFFIIEKNH